MQGSVNGLQARIMLSVRGPHDIGSLKFLVDTGFTGHLSLAQAVIDELGLESADRISAELADGSKVVVDVYTAIIERQGLRSRS